MLIEAVNDPKKRETEWMTRTHPVILENGKIHVTYSYNLKDDEKSIKHVSFTERWIKNNSK